MKYDQLLDQIAHLQTSSQSAAARAVDRLLTMRNWLIGAYVFEFEQNGEDRAAYGEMLLLRLANDLARQGQKGFSATNLKYYRQFALAYPGLRIGQTVSDQFSLEPQTALSEAIVADPGEITTPQFPSLTERHQQRPSLDWQDNYYYERLFASLSWSHLLELSRLDDPLKRAFYELECLKSRWSVRDLKRQIDSLLYERIGLSKDKDAVLALAKEGRMVQTPATVLRDPYVLEFLGLEGRQSYSESDLERALVDHLRNFLLELGNDFCFVREQFRVTVAGRHHYLDLLFYHRGLRCLIAIELKLGEFKHEYAGQMNFYLNYLKENIAHPEEGLPVGIILCAEKDSQEVHYATAGMDQQLFVSRYLVVLPSEEQLKNWLREEQELIEQQLEET